MDTLIEQLKEKIKMCGDATREDRARKGVYVDVLQMVRQAVVVKPTLSEVLAKVEKRAFWDYVPGRAIRIEDLEDVLSEYFA